MTPENLPQYRKMVVYDRRAQDFAMYLNGELVGYAKTYPDACATLNQLVYELITAAQTKEQPDADQTSA